jgi:hypothetical protein
MRRAEKEGGASAASTAWTRRPSSLQSIDDSKTMDGMHPFLPFSTVAFADVGICLKPCTSDADCRASEGYVCAIPMGSLITVINESYARTFCVGPFTFSL